MANTIFIDHGNGEKSVIKSIQSESGRELPEGTEIQLEFAPYAGTALLKIKFPGATGFSDVGLLPIRNEAVFLPDRRAFIAYSREDSAEVEKYWQLLLDAGILPWIDTKDLLGGQNWKLFRDRALRDSDHCVVFLSTKSIERRGEFQNEIRLAIEEARRRPENSNYLIPAKLDEVEILDMLGEYNFIDLRKSDARELLVRSIKNGA